MCNCNPVIPLSEKAKSLVQCLKILFLILLAMIIIQIVIQNLSNGISSIISLMLLMATFLTCHFLFAGIFIFFEMFQIVYGLFFVGLRIQNKIMGFQDRYSTSDGLFITVIVIEILTIIYNVILIYYAFQAYKEFKALYLHRGYCKFIMINLLFS